MKKIAAVTVDVGSAYAADILYHYVIPEEMHCGVGYRVIVPFGKSDRQVTGFIMEMQEQEESDGLKTISSVPENEPAMNPEQRELIFWLRENTFCTYYDAVKTIFPPAIIKNKCRKRKKIPVSVPIEAEPLHLSKEQQHVYDTIAPSLEKDKAECFLIRGVTGSGKTVVFEALIARTLQLGKTALLLLPEIALTPQMIQRFQKRFGSNVALMHSRLSDGERRFAYEQAKNGNARIVIGTRSAVFAPLENIGLIIMDEEGEYSYKSEKAPRYDTIYVAKQRCRYHHAVLIPASATPTIESYYYAQKGIYHLLEMKQRYQNTALPEVTVADMRIERQNGNMSAFSQVLQDAITENLQNHEQSILLLNRRGYHTIISCCICSQPVYCQHCSIPMTWHSTDQLLHCHYCGYTQAIPQNCPQCNGANFRKMGFGTQRLETELAERFPTAKILRMDADTTTRKNAYEENFEAFRKGQYDIMLGTQMIGKGLDFPNVTLVGVLSVDKALFSGDFRSNEKTFSLITQVIGRGGRREKTGKAVLQTFMPEHYVLKLAAEQDYETFFREETAIRKALLFPPFCNICVIGFSGKQKEETELGAKKFYECMENIRSQVQEKMPVRILGPVPCIYEKVNNQYRYQIMIKCKDTPVFRRFIRNTLEQSAKIKEVAKIHVYADMNGNASTGA